MSTTVAGGADDDSTSSGSTSDPDGGSGSAEDAGELEGDEDGMQAAQLSGEAAACGVLVDSHGRSLRAMAGLSLRERYPVQSKQQLLASYGLQQEQQQQQQRSGKQRSAVRGADGGKLRPGAPPAAALEGRWLRSAWLHSAWLHSAC